MEQKYFNGIPAPASKRQKKELNNVLTKWVLDNSFEIFLLFSLPLLVKVGGLKSLTNNKFYSTNWLLSL